MSDAAPALLLAAAGVGFGHAILPDHWVPLAVVGRTRRYPLSRVARLSGLAGTAHVLVSLVLGAVIVLVGLQFRSAIEGAEDTIVGAVLLATAVGFAAMELSGRGHSHSHDGHHHVHADDHAHADDHTHAADHTHADDHAHAADHRHADDHAHAADHSFHHEHAHHHDSRAGRLAAIMVPFGAAASPDLTILPVFLAATTAGVLTAIGSLFVFAAVTITTMVTLTVIATRSGYQVKGAWLERWGNILTAGVLVVLGVLIITGTI